MKTKDMTSALNAKIVGIVCLLIIITTCYNHWLALREENDKNIKLMIEITDLLLERIPTGVFSQANADTTVSDKSNLQMAMLLNGKLQPILTNILIPSENLKFGFYSRQCGRIVAVGPTFDQSNISDMKDEQLKLLRDVAEPMLFSESRSVMWHGADALTYGYPIIENNAVVGCAFASIRQDNVTSYIWGRTFKTFLGAFVMLLICLLALHELFLKLKVDLRGYAEAVLIGDAAVYRSQIPEFTPLLNYISEQTDKMTRLDRLNIIGEMAAGIAHEIRNPMTTVRGLLQYMGRKKEFAGHDHHFALMINELDRANNIITEFLSLSKDRALELKENDLNAIIEELFPLLQSDALNHDCNIELHLNQLHKILLDKSSIRQLILNIVRNAMDAMPNGGVVKITTDLVNASKVRLTIEDSGIGMSQEVKDKLGTPFFTTKEKGTGLGLAICFRIVHRHAAIMTIDSKLGGGTKFNIQFN